MPGVRFFERLYEQQLQRCATIRRRELHELLPEASVAFSARELNAERPWVGGRPKIGVIMALTTKESDFYARTLDMWRCYCAIHKDCEVVLETPDFLPDGRYPYTHALNPHTGDVEVKVGKAWNRWYALRRHLDAYEWVFTADPDQFPSWECFNSVPLSEALKSVDAEARGRTPPVVVMRDFPRYHTLNSAGIFFRGGAASRLLLEILFGRAFWEGCADFDQSAFDHTILEFTDLWAKVSLGGQLQSHRCLVEQFPSLENRNSLEPYVNCWHDYMDRLFGPYEQRQFGTSPMRLVDPAKIDINYVVGGRTSKDAPLIWHQAGKNKHYREPVEQGGLSVMDRFIASDWGLDPLPPGSGLNATGLNCSAWEEAAGRFTGVAHPGSEVVDCRGSWLAVC